MRGLLVTLMLLSITCACHENNSDENKKPNFVFFLADDLGYGDVHFTNPEAYIETPNLDKLAASGAILSDCYSASSMCSPSRAGLLTGRTPTRIGIHDWIKEIYKKPLSNVHLPASETTIAELLKDDGYATAIIGKWHLNNGFNSGNKSDPHDHGFEYWFATAGQSEPSHRNPTNYFENGVPVGQLGNKENSQYSSTIVAEKTIKWLKNLNQDKSFFLYVPFHEPHVICDAPDHLKEKYLDEMSNGAIPILDNTGDKGLGQAEYYASVENMDAAIGTIIGYLKESGLLDNTWIFFSSDNGPDTGRKYQGRLQSVGQSIPFRGRKRWILEGGIHQASIVSKPGSIQPGTTISTPIGHVDLLPTICDLTGLKLPSTRLDGTSVVNILNGQNSKRLNNPLHWHFYSPRGDSPQSVMRKGQWVITANWDTHRPAGRFNLEYIELIKNSQLRDFALYNIKEDPTQESPQNENYPEILKELSIELCAIHKEVVNECPDQSNFTWTPELQTITNLRYPKKKE